MGEDITSINFHEEEPLSYFDFGFNNDDDATEEVETFRMQVEGELAPFNSLFGSGIIELPQLATSTLSFPTFLEFEQHKAATQADTHFTDVVEICGGTARTSHVLIKRWHEVHVGKNFDAVCGIDLRVPAQVVALWRYMTNTKPLVAVIATPCTGLSGYASVNAARSSQVPTTHMTSNERDANGT